MASVNGPNKPLMRSNTGVQDPLLHNPSQSPFSYTAPMTVCSHIEERIVYSPLNFNGLPGTKYNFSLTKQADLLGPVFARIYFEPLLQPAPPYAGNVTAVRYINNLGIGCIESCRILYGSNQIANILPEWMYIRYRKYLATSAAAAWRVLSQMDLSFAEQQAFAASGGEVFVNLCVPWGDDSSQYFSMCAMATELRIEITLKPLRNLLQHTVNNNQIADQLLFQGQSTNIIREFQLYCQCVHLTGAERDTVISNVKSEDGLAKLVEDIQAHIRVLIPVNPSPFTYRLKLTNINAPVTSLFWYLEDPVNTAGTAANNSNGGDFPHNPIAGLGVQWGTYAIQSNGNMVIPVTTSFLARYYHHVRWFSGANPGEYLVGYSFSQQPEIPNASYGTMNFGQLDLPELQITFPAGLNNAYDQFGQNQGAYLNVIGDTKNFLHEQGGDFTRTFY